MKFTNAALTTSLMAAALPATSSAWSLGGPRFYVSRPCVVYPPTPGAMLQKNLGGPMSNRAFRQTSPRYEITDNEEKFQVAVDVPGVKLEDINVNVEEDGRVLTISGQRERSNDSYQFTSKFSQSFSLDQLVDVDRIAASLKNGVLIVSAPKDAEKVKENLRTIPVMLADDEDEESTDVVNVHAAESSEEELLGGDGGDPRNDAGAEDDSK